MRLRQETKQKRAEQIVVEGKSMTDPIGQTGKAKSIELESQKVKDVAKCQDVDWKENDR